MPIELIYGERIGNWALGDLEADRMINILDGSVRSGKTWGLIPKIIFACSNPVQGWRFITGTSKQSIFTNVLGDLFNIIGPRDYKYNAQSGLLTLFGVPWMVMGAKDEGSEKYLRGATIGVAICDEVVLMPKAFFQMLLTRMSPKGARLYGTTNPDQPLHWLKTDYIDDEKLKRMGLIFRMHCTMDDNPNLTPEYIESQKALYKGMFYRRYILGEWVMAEGSIYRDSWSDELIYDEPPITLKNAGGFVDRFVSVDCGVDHPQVYGEFWDDGKTLWMEKEYFWDSRKEMRQKTDGQYADDLMEFMGINNACQIIVPPEAASFRAELVLRGLWVTEANNEVEEGIKTVASAMSTRILRINRRCKETLKGIELYAWDHKAAKRGVEQPLKENDDSVDCLRYALHTKIPKWRLVGQGIAA